MNSAYLCPSLIFLRTNSRLVHNKRVQDECSNTRCSNLNLLLDNTKACPSPTGFYSHAFSFSTCVLSKEGKNFRAHWDQLIPSAFTRLSFTHWAESTPYPSSFLSQEQYNQLMQLSSSQPIDLKSSFVIKPAGGMSALVSMRTHLCLPFSLTLLCRSSRWAANMPLLSIEQALTLQSEAVWSLPHRITSFAHFQSMDKNPGLFAPEFSFRFPSSLTIKQIITQCHVWH